MTTVSLSELLSIRDDSLRVTRERRRYGALIMARLRAVDLSPVRRALLVSLLFLTRHALVLSGCAAVVTAAAMITPALGWLTTGAALFFLEARRR